MKIKNIKINSYGTLKEKEINLNHHMNIIYGKNESGKSTLLNFIKNIFYGISKNKNGKEISDYEKYLPWSGEEFSGKIQYELNNKKVYEIYRDFHKKNPKIFNENLEEVSHEFKIDKKDGNQFFYEQTGVGEQTYLSTIMASQQEVVLTKQSQNNLVQKVANLGGTGDDEVSFQKAIDKLNKRQVEEVGTARTQDRPLNLLQNRNKELEFVLKDEKVHAQNKEILNEQKQKIQEQLEQEKQKNDASQKLHKLFYVKEMELEKNNLKNKINNEKEEKIKKIIQEKEKLINQESQNENIENKKEIKKKLNKKINRNYLFLFIIFILLIIINILNFIFISNKIINYAILALIPIHIIIFISYYLKNTKKINNIENEIIQEKQNEQKIKEQISILNSQINLLKEEIKNQEEETGKELQTINLKINNEKQKIKENSSIILEEIFQIEEKNQLEKILENSNKNIMDYNLQLNSIKYEEETITKQLEKIISIQEEQADIKEQLEILEQKNKCFQATKELLEKAYEKMKNNVTPKFTQNLSNIVQNISNGKYKKVSIHEEKGLIVELENGEYIPANLLSIGTIDQLYLALRLSMLDEISKEKMPIILDETFAYFDDERLRNILQFLAKEANEHQIILLTCTKREKEILDNLQVEYNWVEL